MNTTNLRDLKFLESEFLTFLLINYFLKQSTIDLKNHNFEYFPIKHIILASENNEEKVTIETNNVDLCNELYTALNNGKQVMSIELLMKSGELEIGATFKTNPLRMVKISAPKSIAEEEQDRIIERLLYTDLVFECYDFLIKHFVEVRVKENWGVLLKEFETFLKENDS